MSGPKVVRIVTREEIIATCNGHLARLDAAISDFDRFCRARNLATDEDLAALQTRRIDIHKLLADEKFLELQKRVPDEIERLDAERVYRTEKAAERAARQALELRRARGVARTLLATETGLAADLVRQLKAIDGGAVADIERANSVLAKAYAQKWQGESEDKLETKLKRAAAKWTDGSAATPLADWTALIGEENDAEVRELMALISAVAIEAGEDTAKPFRDRLDGLQGEHHGSSLKLRRDSLTLDLKELLRRSREERARRTVLAGLTAEWALLSNTEPPWAAAVDANPAALDEAIATAQKAVDAERQRLQVQARRDAVLKELAALGYEVHEGLQTALAKDGKVVLRKATTPDYGVEVVAPEKGDRLAFRAVAFGHASTPRDKVRDRDAEVLWCSDFRHLEQNVRANAGHVMIEKAIPAGAEPLKVIESTINQSTSVDVAGPPISLRRM